MGATNYFLLVGMILQEGRKPQKIMNFFDRGAHIKYVLEKPLFGTIET